MSKLRLEKATATERENLAPARAVEWAKGISVEGFCQRNARLYAHPFGVKHTETLLLKDDKNEMVSSMDSVSVPTLQGRTFLIASVFTPPVHRGHGYAGEMLTQFLQTKESKTGLLYSDIGLGFYEKWDFQPSPVTEVTLPTIADGPRDLQELEIGTVLACIQAIREQALKESAVPATAFLPEGEWVDWHLERFRVFAGLVGQTLPRELAWECPSGKILVVPYFQRQTLIGMWVENDACVPYLQRLAYDLGFSKIEYWDPENTRPGKKIYPMAQGRQILNCQFLENW